MFFFIFVFFVNFVGIGINVGNVSGIGVLVGNSGSYFGILFNGWVEYFLIFMSLDGFDGWDGLMFFFGFGKG